MTTEQLYELYLAHPAVQTDTRKLKKGDLFLALKGPSFNGNRFAAGAIEAGAEWAVIDEESAAIPGRTILVNDVLAALQELARHHREQFSIPFLAITGSNGKTTTKELVHEVLSQKYVTYTTRGNLNNHIGIPLTLLSVKKDAQIAVIEMGANHQQEIAGYCRYVQPTHGIITNVGLAHLEGFGGPEGVKKGKGELFDYLATHNGSAFAMWDYDYLQEMSRKVPHTITYGTSDASLTGHPAPSATMLRVQFTKGIDGIVQTQLAGDYNLPNVLCAAAVGHFFQVPAHAIKAALEAYTPSNSRSQWMEKDGNDILLDAYNANPSSMQLAIENFARLPATDKVLILGGMAELGSSSLDEHRSIIELINRHTWRAVALTGGDFLRLDHAYHSFPTVAETAQWLKQQHFRGVSMLVKGSRSMQMEKVLE